jgi:hypothetical protein
MLRAGVPALAACIAAVALAAAGPAAAQQRLPDHRVDLLPDQTCVATFLPAERRGTQAPLLQVSARGRMPSERIALGVAAAAGVEVVEFVADNERKPVAAAAPAPLARVMTSPAWLDIQRVGDGGRPFWLSAEGADGFWHSARYEGLTTAGIVQVLERSCAIAAGAPGPAPGPTEADLRGAETALSLTEGQRRHIRWVLAQRYGGAAASPGTGGVLTSEDRGRLERFSRETGLPASRYLTAETARRLLAEPFSPRTTDTSLRGRDVLVSGSWASMRARTGFGCEVMTDALTVTGLDLWEMPVMSFRITERSTGNSMIIDLIEPNPFLASAPVRVIVDGRSYPLVSEEGAIKLPRAGPHRDNAAIKAIRRGNRIEFQGTSSADGRAGRVVFSAVGFTAAFDRMMRLCNRPRLADWFR